MKPWRNSHRASSVALTNENLLRREGRTDFGDAGGRRLRGCLAGFYPLQTHLKKDSTANTPLCAVLCLPVGWVSAPSARSSRYVERHQRITIPAVLRASEMLHNLSDIQTRVHAPPPRSSKHCGADHQPESHRGNRAPNIHGTGHLSNAHAVRTHPVYQHFIPFQFCTHHPSTFSFVFPVSPDKTAYPLD